TRPPPLGYTPVQRVRKGFIIGGGTTFGATYLLSAFSAAVADDVDGSRSRLRSLYVPVFGPFLQMSETSSSTGKFVLGLLGGAQTAGAIMLIYGITSPKTILVRNDLVSVQITPAIGGSSTGMVVSGQF